MGFFWGGGGGGGMPDSYCLGWGGGGKQWVHEEKLRVAPINDTFSVLSWVLRNDINVTETH